MIEWEEMARCLHHDPDLFFAPGAAHVRRAKAICTRCEVRGECLEYALKTRVDSGVWGGMNERERRALLRRQPALVRHLDASPGHRMASVS